MTSLSVAPKVLYVVELLYLLSICISPPELDQVGRQPWMCLLPSSQLEQANWGKCTHLWVRCSAPTPSSMHQVAKGGVKPGLRSPKPLPGSGLSLSGTTWDPSVQSIPGDKTVSISVCCFTECKNTW